MAGHKCRKCGEPERSVLEDVELVRLFEFEPTSQVSERELYEVARGDGLAA